MKYLRSSHITTNLLLVIVLLASSCSKKVEDPIPYSPYDEIEYRIEISRFIIKADEQGLFVDSCEKYDSGHWRVLFTDGTTIYTPNYIPTEKKLYGNPPTPIIRGTVVNYDNSYVGFGFTDKIYDWQTDNEIQIGLLHNDYNPPTIIDSL